jgi:hypothetical protein
MNLGRNRQYKLILLACFVGYIWIYFGIFQGIYQNKSFEVCLLKRFVNIPCPSCGITRSVAAILIGDFERAFYINPYGFVVISFLIVTPFWIIIDLKSTKNSFLNFYKFIEQKLNQPLNAILFYSIVLVNWFWNIAKHL